MNDIVFAFGYVKYTVFIHKYPWLLPLPDYYENRTPKCCDMDLGGKFGKSK